MIVYIHRDSIVLHWIGFGTSSSIERLVHTYADAQAPSINLGVCHRYSVAGGCALRLEAIAL